MLRQRNVRWPNTPVVDVGSEVEVWASELAEYPVELVEQILRDHDGGFALTIGEVRAQAKARTPRRSAAPASDGGGVDWDRQRRWRDVVLGGLRLHRTPAVNEAIAAANAAGADALEAAEAVLEHEHA